MKKVESKVKKVSEYQLSKLKEQTQVFDKVKAALGELSLQYEFSKNAIMVEFYDAHKKNEDLKKKLEIEFGRVSINLDNGEVTEIKEQKE